jgi:hypothetical protein
MSHLSPYDYIIGFASVTALVSLIDMIDTLRFFILLLTAVGTLIKVIEQFYKSKDSLNSLKSNIEEKWLSLMNKIKR